MCIRDSEKGIAMGCANSILIKVNQIGSLSETLDAIEMAHRHGYTCLLYTSTQNGVGTQLGFGRRAVQLKHLVVDRTLFQ